MLISIIASLLDGHESMLISIIASLLNGHESMHASKLILHSSKGQESMMSIIS